MVISFFLFAATEVNLKLLFNRVKVCIVEGIKLFMLLPLRISIKKSIYNMKSYFCHCQLSFFKKFQSQWLITNKYLNRYT